MSRVKELMACSAHYRKHRFGQRGGGGGRKGEKQQQHLKTTPDLHNPTFITDAPWIFQSSSFFFAERSNSCLLTTWSQTFYSTSQHQLLKVLLGSAALKTKIIRNLPVLSCQGSLSWTARTKATMRLPGSKKMPIFQNFHIIDVYFLWAVVLQCPMPGSLEKPLGDLLWPFYFPFFLKSFSHFGATYIHDITLHRLDDKLHWNNVIW